MALTKDDILNAIAEMPVMELVELIEAAEEKFNVTATAAVAAVAAGPAAVVEEQTEFDVVLTSFGATLDSFHVDRDPSQHMVGQNRIPPGFEEASMYLC